MKNLSGYIVKLSGLLQVSTAFLVFLFFVSVDKSLSSDYVWPTNASKYLTSNFCEYRDNHFHSGIDIKTWGRNGYKVFAINDGSLVRLKVSPYGYGKVLYIQHNDGRFSVYGHLLKFAGRFQNIVKNEQKKRSKFTVEMFFKGGEITVKKGELIAYTGRSGTVSPHLHFEIRDENHNPINPNIYGYKIDDKFSPVVKAISFSPLDHSSTVNRDHKPLIIKANQVSNKKFIIPEAVELWGNIGVGISAYDKDGNVNNVYDPYFIEFIVGGEQIFNVKYDIFSFNKTREVYLDRDFRLIKRGFGIFNKLYKDIGNTLSFYGNYKTFDGVIKTEHFENNEIREDAHTFRIILRDASGNSSLCAGRFIFKKPDGINADKDNDNSYFSSSDISASNNILTLKGDLYDSYLRLEITSSEAIEKNPVIEVYNNEKFEVNLKTRKLNDNLFVGIFPLRGDDVKNLRFTAKGKSVSGRTDVTDYFIRLFPVSKDGGRFISEDNNCILEFLGGAVYNKFWGRISEVNEENSIGIGKVYSLEPFDIPLKHRAKLSIMYPENVTNKEKIGIYSLADEEWGYSKSELNKQFTAIEGNINEMKTYTLIMDIEPPVIYKIIPGDGAEIKNRRPKITVYFKDELSGIEGEESIILKVDGEKVISEYDPPMDNVFYVPEKPLSYGQHSIEFEIKDNMNNFAVRKSTFTISDLR